MIFDFLHIFACFYNLILGFSIELARKRKVKKEVYNFMTKC